MKSCKSCGVLKDMSEYYVHSAMADGHLNFCKACKRAAAISNRDRNLEYYREYDRSRANAESRVAARKEYVGTAAGKATKKRAIARYRQQNPLKVAAHTAVRKAVVSGELIRKPCEVCGTQGAHAHHDDYAFQLDVRWLCPSHHTQWHKENVTLFNGEPF